MNCNCISELEKKLAERYSAELGSPASVECADAGFSMAANSICVIHKTEFKVTAQAKGWSRGKVIPVIASFCPFCGKHAGEGDTR